MYLVKPHSRDQGKGQIHCVSALFPGPESGALPDTWAIPKHTSGGKHRSGGAQPVKEGGFGRAIPSAGLSCH